MQTKYEEKTLIATRGREIFLSESTNKTDSQYHKTMEVRRQWNVIYYKITVANVEFYSRIFKSDTII